LSIFFIFSSTKAEKQLFLEVCLSNPHYLNTTLNYLLDTTLYMCQRLAAGRWFSPCSLVSCTNKTDRYDITQILLKVALNTITQHPLNYLSTKVLYM